MVFELFFLLCDSATQELVRVRVIEGSSYREKNYSKCMNEIHGKSILVQVSVRFELAGVRVIGIRLDTIFIIISALQSCRY